METEAPAFLSTFNGLALLVYLALVCAALLLLAALWFHLKAKEVRTLDDEIAKFLGLDDFARHRVDSERQAEHFDDDPDYRI